MPHLADAHNRRSSHDIYFFPQQSPIFLLRTALTHFRIYNFRKKNCQVIIFNHEKHL